MYCRLNEVLKEKGKSVYWLVHTVGLAHKSAYDLVNGKTKGIQFETLEKICLALKCNPNDLIVCDFKN